MMSESNLSESGMDCEECHTPVTPAMGTMSCLTVMELIETVAQQTVEGCDSNLADDFSGWLQDQDIEPDCPPEWFEAWHDYINREES